MCDREWTYQGNTPQVSLQFDMFEEQVKVGELQQLAILLTSLCEQPIKSTARHLLGALRTAYSTTYICDLTVGRMHCALLLLPSGCLGGLGASRPVTAACRQLAGQLRDHQV